MRTKIGVWITVPVVLATSWLVLPRYAAATQESADVITQKAVFAGGCFWCVEANFEKVDGVISAVSGYTGGHVENPTYQEVCSHTTGHLESVEVTYDTNKLTYNDMLEVYWRTIDPTDASGSFHDRGEPYTSAIFVDNDQQRHLAEQSIERLVESGRFEKPIVTKILDASKFHVAEDYHQNYHLTHPKEYHAYRNASGRDQYIARTWGEDADYKIPSKKQPMATLTSKVKDDAVVKWTDAPLADYKKPSDETLRKQLSDLEYRVTQREATEPPFSNTYWNEHREGIFVDIVSGEPLFSSADKFQSGTGWPSFSKPLVSSNVARHVDNTLSSTRTEVRSRHADSHLGHVFNDGPTSTRLRYCLDSAALRFIPKDQLVANGYGFFQSQFADEESLMRSQD